MGVIGLVTSLNRNIGADVLAAPFNGGHQKPLSTCPLVHLVLIIKYDNTSHEIIHHINHSRAVVFFGGDRKRQVVRIAHLYQVGKFPSSKGVGVLAIPLILMWEIPHI